MSKTPIEWTQQTWNPVRGCSRISEGCRNCYAERQAARNLPGLKSPTTGEPFALMTPSGPRWTGKVELIPHMLDIPLRRKVPTTYFVNSMSDLFHESLSDDDIDRVFAVMALCPQHTFQVLTKRPERMREYFADPERPVKLDVALLEAVALPYNSFGGRKCFVQRGGVEGWPLPNVSLGVSVEDQAAADLRIPPLLQTPAAVRFVSAEPLLGPVDLSAYMWPVCWHWAAGYKSPKDALAAGAYAEQKRQGLVGAWCRFLDWVIVGGESGPGARPCDLAWIRSIVAQCEAAKVPCFVKQLGARPCARWIGGEDTNWKPGTLGDFDAEVPGRWNAGLRDRKGGDMAEWPQDLRVRQMPGATSPAMASAASVTVGQGETDLQADSNGL